MPCKDDIESVILDQVRENPAILASIQYPSENLQFVCVCMNPKNILYMNNYTEYTERLALSTDPEIIFKIKNPYQESIRQVLSEQPSFIVDYGEKIPYETKLKIIQSTPTAILFFNHRDTKFNRGLDYDMIWKAVYKDPQIIFNIMVKKYHRMQYFTEELLIMSITQCWNKVFYNRIISDYKTSLYEKDIEMTNEQHDRIVQKINKLKLSKGSMD